MTSNTRDAHAQKVDGDPLGPIGIIGNPPSLTGSIIFFDCSEGSWRLACAGGNSRVPPQPYSCLLNSGYKGITPASIVAAPGEKPKYSPLSTARRDIRLLVVLPRTSCAAAGLLLECCLVHVSLDDHPPFTALSYTWGDQSTREPILLDGKVLSIGLNLHDALRRIQRDNDLEFIWADAICINQEDIPEKNFQVSLMKDIFGQSRLMVAWIGRHDGNSELAVHEIKRVGRAFWQIEGGDSSLLERISKPSTPPGWQLSEARNRAGKEFSQGREGRATFAAYEAVAALMLRPYWERVWTQQEMALPRFMVFLCGNSEPFTTLELVAIWEAMMRYRVSGDKAYRPVPGEKAMDRAVLLQLLALPNNRHKALLKHLIIAENLHATDARDHVFALLGVSVDADSLGLQADYSSSVEGVYTDLVAAYIRKGDLDLIPCSQIPKKIPGLPSWVPDWTSHISLLVPGVAIDAENYIRFAASGSSTANAAVVEGVTNLGNPASILRASGVVVDTVASVGRDWTTTAPTGVVHPESHKVGLELLDDVKRLIRLRGRSRGDVDGEEEERQLAFEMLLSRDPNTGLYNKDGSEVEEEISSYRESYDALERLAAVMSKSSDDEIETELLVAEGVVEISRSSLFVSSAIKRVVTQTCRLFLTETGHLGLGPSPVDVGDAIAILHGASVPYVLRRSKTTSARYNYLGTCYVRRLMNGELFEKSIAEETFEIE